MSRCDPQKRPGTHARGFVHAYSPVLADCGISQSTFMQLLQDFEKAIKVCRVLSSGL